MTHNILFIDDEKDITDALERHFRKKYTIFKANTGVDGLKILRKEKISLIVSDQRMPTMTGVEFFEQAQRIQPDAVRILLTGYTDVESVIAAINAGHIYRYVTKPWDPNDLEIAVARGIDAYCLKTELKEKNEALERALDELKVLDVAKSHFMILIGHELKTPLTTINSFLGLLKEETLSGDAVKYLARIEQGSGRLQEIVFDVLDLLSAESGQMPVKIEKINLQSLAQSTIAGLEALAKKRNLRFENKLAQNPQTSDPKILSKVLDKIIHNAVKYATENSAIRITNLHDGRSGVFVENQGPAISPKIIEKILRPFSADEDIMHHSQGLGLGLSLSQALLKPLGTNLEVFSSPASTVVGFQLPDAQSGA